MSESPRLPPETFALGRIASLLVMLGAVLYFTGWTYRWIYFGFFQLEVTTLPLPLESFYIAAFQVFFGSFRAILHTIITIALIVVGVYCSLWLLEGQPSQGFQAGMQKIYQRTLDCLNTRLTRGQPPQRLWKRGLFRLYRGLLQLVKSFLEFHLLEYQSLRFLRSLLDETLIICWLLAGCFWLAQWQGEADAWRDAVNETSSLPVVTVVVREDSFPLGVNPDDIRNPQGIRIIGDASSYQQLLSAAINNPSQNRVWRLLIDVDGDYYIFPALPEPDQTRRPPLVVMPRSHQGDRLIQLRPTLDTDIPSRDNK
ncbi:hypothetical protein [Arthrospira platensis]|uniref:hypothetical protein n=1 Tax=Limnospira TaxID=2596745 RepID=UPI0007A10259|nr:hypothetical protein [Arthrospira platensis]AMW26901.1 hypothetical protein AP285_01710 [Arthrospira platensis YZ]MBD2670241.1 hypothetical protein [Arthrospira platensis FACHB-439]MBD2710844.1 hypothetical protein [Arthrospira platensis FACHB-835]MDT9183466.1 hypothetical protein [Limnospira sp. PMC 289.06]MDT9294476.1 hypothetical protein [Arthrospira platensis PCC 7345]QQW29650.1 hypothetical protein AP9108_01770 [Arthrospira sp. PCC 9108]